MLTAEQVRELSDSRLLSKVAEESSEVIKAAMKMAAHGARPCVDGVQYDNVRDTVEEFDQLSLLMAEFRIRFCDI